LGNDGPVSLADFPAIAYFKSPLDRPQMAPFEISATAICGRPTILRA
jgi:hypothetical protein